MLQKKEECMMLLQLIHLNLVTKRDSINKYSPVRIVLGGRFFRL